jgi:hypothetical protein
LCRSVGSGVCDYIRVGIRGCCSISTGAWATIIAAPPQALAGCMTLGRFRLDKSKIVHSTRSSGPKLSLEWVGDLSTQGWMRSLVGPENWLCKYRLRLRCLRRFVVATRRLLGEAVAAFASTHPLGPMETRIVESDSSERTPPGLLRASSLDSRRKFPPETRQRGRGAVWGISFFVCPASN